MSIKKVEIEVRVCDKCDKPIKGRLIVHVCPCCGKEICNKCQEIEDIRHKPKRKYTRKEKAEPIVIIPELEEMEEGLNSEGLTLTKPKRQRKSLAEQSQEISTTPIEEK